MGMGMSMNILHMVVFFMILRAIVSIKKRVLSPVVVPLYVLLLGLGLAYEVNEIFRCFALV